MYTISTALAIENREGKLFVFMPPLKTVEHYLELLAVVEQSAQQLGLQIIIEVRNAEDNRIEQMAITPDPGVVEVNIHPSSSWQEVKAKYQTLFNVGERVGLAAEKFMLDGRHTGSGGGHHITLGGATPAESPLLKNPSVLRSFITFGKISPFFVLSVFLVLLLVRPVKHHG